MDSSARFRVVFAASLLIYVLGYIGLATVYPKYPESVDMAVYSTVLLQRENPELFPRDLSYADGAATETYWSSGLVYMRLFQFIHTLTQRNISQTLALLHLIPSLVSIVTFYWFLRVFRKDRWLTLMLAFGLCTFLVARFAEAIPTLYYFACIPVFLRLLWQYVIEPGLYSRSFSLWRIAAIGALIGSSPLLINSVNGLGFSTLSLMLVTVMLLARRLSWQAYAAFIIGLVPLLGLVALGGTGGANAAQNLESARRILDDGFIATALHRGTFFEAIVEQLVGIPYTAVLYLPVGLALILLSLWLYKHPHASRAMKIFYLTLSWIFWASTLGNVGLILYIYYLSRVILRRDTLLDHVFIASMNIGVFNGPVLIWFTLGVWEVTQWHTLVFILSQMFRFKFLTFFMSLAPLLFMFDALTDPISSVRLRRATQALLVVLLMLQNYDILNLFIPLYAFLILVVILIEFGVHDKIALHLRRRASLLSKALYLAATFKLSFASIFIALVLLGTSYQYWRSDRPLTLETILHPYKAAKGHDDQAHHDYLEMTDWIRVNTPPTSLIHMTDPLDNHFFRYLTERSLLYNWMDYLLGATTAAQSSRVAQLRLDVLHTEEIFSTSIAARYDADYMVMSSASPTPIPTWDDKHWYWPDLAFKNQTYSVYRVERLNTSQLITHLFKPT